MSHRAQDQVARLHRAMDHPVESIPRTISSDRRFLRTRLMISELAETVDAMARDDLPEIADGLGDLLVVVYGTAIEYGFDMEPIFNLIHKANMAKVGGGKDGSGKFLKPEGWEPPDIMAEIRRQLNG